MNKVEIFLDNSRRNAIYPLELLIASQLVFRIADLFRTGNYHWIFSYGSLLGYLLLFSSIVFSFFNGILLISEIVKSKKKSDLWLALLSFSPIFYLVYIFSPLF